VQFAPVTLAVLTPDHWPKIVDEPYGMPSISDSPPYVFVMPESWEGVTWMPFPKREDTDPDLVARALVAGRTWNRVRLECGDGIGTHEIGHSIVRQLGIAPQVLWLDELLASYVGYAYLAAKDPMRALSTDIFATDGLKHSAHPFTRLEDFESNYTTLSQKYPANYVWYQFSFDQRVRQTFRQRGVDFLRQLQVTLPTGGPKLDTTQVLAKLETINPGWEAWAARVNSGEISRSR
jgi:hypothetical protein